MHLAIASVTALAFSVAEAPWACVLGSGRVVRKTPNWGFPRTAIPICGSCWCSAHIIFLGIGEKDSALRRWGLSKTDGGHKATLRAVVAVARKLSVLLHRLWAKNESYKPFPQMA